MMDTFHQFETNKIRKGHGIDEPQATNIQERIIQSALDRSLTNLRDTDVRVLMNLCSSVMDPKGKDTVEYKDWNSQFLYVCFELCKYLAKDEVLCDSIGPCEVKHVLFGQGGTITVVLVLEDDML
jgi:hypothetical protein